MARSPTQKIQTTPNWTCLEFDTSKRLDAMPVAAAIMAELLARDLGQAGARRTASSSVEGVPGQADQRREVAGGQPAAPPGVEDEQPLLGGEAGRGGRGPV